MPRWVDRQHSAPTLPDADSLCGRTPTQGCISSAHTPDPRQSPRSAVTRPTRHGPGPDRQAAAPTAGKAAGRGPRRGRNKALGARLPGRGPWGPVVSGLPRRDRLALAKGGSRSLPSGGPGLRPRVSRFRPVSSRAQNQAPVCSAARPPPVPPEREPLDASLSCPLRWCSAGTREAHAGRERWAAGPHRAERPRVLAAQRSALLRGGAGPAGSPGGPCPGASRTLTKEPPGHLEGPSRRGRPGTPVMGARAPQQGPVSGRCPCLWRSRSGTPSAVVCV